MGITKTYYGIKFPFTILNDRNVFIDLNNDLHEKVASEIAHVILTPKKTRLRMPDFGTDLIRFIFSPNDEISWTDIESEIYDSVNKYVPNASINKVDVYKNEEKVENCWVYNRYFTATIITWIEKRRIMVKKWNWRKLALIENFYYEYYLHQNNPKITTTTYDGEYSTNSIIDSKMSSEMEKAKIWFTQNFGEFEIKL